MTGVSFVAQVQIPQVPNYLRQMMYPLAPLVPVDALSDEELRRVGEAWTEALIARARELRASRGPRSGSDG